MKPVILLFLSLTISSCSMMFNGQYCVSEIQSDKSRTVAVNGDTLRLVPGTMETVTLKRSKIPVPLYITEGENAGSEIALRPKISPAFWCNFLFPYFFIGDGWSEKKWQYPSKVQINREWIESGGRIDWDYSRFAHKGAVNLRIGIPYLNVFSVYSPVADISNKGAGFYGIYAGIDWFYKDRLFLSLTGNVITNIITPLPPLPIYSDDRAVSVYLSLSNNHSLFRNRFSIGYGISFGEEQWTTKLHRGQDFCDLKQGINVNYTRSRSRSLGLVIPVYYYTKRSFYMGMTYRPMFMQMTKKISFRYQHTLSIELGWRIRLKR